MRKLHWNRRKRTVRNLLAAVLLLLLTWALTGFPALTKGMLARQVARRNLLPQAEVVYQDRDRQGHRQMYLQSGEDFLRFSYSRNILVYGNWEADLFRGDQGMICLPESQEPGVFLALGDLAGGEQAELKLSLSTDWEKSWTLRGEPVSEHCFRFTAEDALAAEPELMELLPAVTNPEEFYAYTLRLYDSGGRLLKTVAGPA